MYKRQASEGKKKFFGKKEKKDKKDEKIEELTDRVTRQMAEFDNFRKRSEKEDVYKRQLVLLANESQDKVHYAMPHKVMLYDGMDYETQIRNNWKNFNDRRKQNKKTGQPLEHLTAGEYLSRFRKKDRLIPIISLVFYYGSEPWEDVYKRQIFNYFLLLVV